MLVTEITAPVINDFINLFGVPATPSLEATFLFTRDILSMNEVGVAGIGGQRVCCELLLNSRIKWQKWLHRDDLRLLDNFGLAILSQKIQIVFERRTFCRLKRLFANSIVLILFKFVSLVLLILQVGLILFEVLHANGILLTNELGVSEFFGLQLNVANVPRVIDHLAILRVK